MHQYIAMASWHSVESGHNEKNSLGMNGAWPVQHRSCVLSSPAQTLVMGTVDDGAETQDMHHSKARSPVAPGGGGGWCLVNLAVGNAPEGRNKE